MVLPQVGFTGSADSTGSAGQANATCSEHDSSGLMTCARLQAVLGQAGWLNENTENVCDVHSPAALQAVQTAAACALRGGGGYVCMLFPSGLQIQNNPEELARFSGVSLVLTVRLLYITVVGNLFMVGTRCLEVATRAPHPATGAVLLRNTCVLRGLEAPRFASMLEIGGRCVWYCTADRVRRPWNSDPPTNASLSQQSCWKVPADFVAVEFVMRVELDQTSVVPRLLQPEVSQWLDAVSLTAEAHLQQAAGAAGLQNFSTILSVPGTAYHTQDLSSLMLGVIRTRQAPYDAVALDSPWWGPGDGPSAAGARRRMGTTDLVVQGLHVGPAGLISDAALEVLAEEAVAVGVDQRIAEAPPGVKAAWVQQIVELYRPEQDPDERPEAAPDVIFSSFDITVMILTGAILLSCCACSVLCERVQRRTTREKAWELPEI